MCFAQIEVQKEELLEHQGIVTVSGKSANAIYDQLKIWAVTQFPNDSAVQLDDKENGKLILKGEQSFSFKPFFSTKRGSGMSPDVSTSHLRWR